MTKVNKEKRDNRFFENWFSGDGQLIDKEEEKKKMKSGKMKSWGMRANTDFVCVLIRSWVRGKDFIPDDTIDDTLEFLFYMGYKIGLKEGEEND